MSNFQRLRAVLTGVVATALAVATLPVLASTASAAAADPLGGQAGPVTLLPTMATDNYLPVVPAGTTLDYFLRHPVLSWQAITSLPVTSYRVQISPNAEFTNNTVTLPNGGLTTATEYDLPQTLPHGSYFWRVRGEDVAGHATLWTGAVENDTSSHWQFTKTWPDAPTGLLPVDGASGVVGRTFSWNPLPDASAYQFEISTNSAFPSSDPSETTWECETNHTSITPFMKDPANIAMVPDSYVIGSCGNTDALMQKLRTGFGTWYWRVRGIDGSTAGKTPAEGETTCSTDGSDCSQSSPVYRITFAPQPSNVPTNGFTFAPPTNLTTGCTATLAGGSGEPLCYDTPTFSWTPVPGQAYDSNAYKVTVYTDPYASTAFHSYITFDTHLTPRDSYFDNQAGRSYYWTVEACVYVAGGVNQNLSACSLTGNLSAFHKSSPPLPVAPANAASTPGHNGLYVTTDNNETFATAVRQVHTQQMTFHWDGLLEYTQQAGIQSNQEAMDYRLQYTTDGNWLTATSVDVDATHWTKTDGFLADGGYSWRVAPLDGSDNVLSWSAPQTVAKGSVAPTVSIGQTGVLAPTSAVTLVFATPVTGVSGATLGLKLSTGAHLAGTLVSTGPVSATFTPDKPLLPGQRVLPWVTSGVQDLAGNAAQVSPGTSLVDPTVDSAAPTITTSWAKIATGHASGGSYAKSASTRDAIRFTTTGSSLQVLGVRTPDGGYATVSVDGVPKKTVNFYAKKAAYGVKVFSALLNEGPHVVTISVKGNHAKGSTGNAVNVDAIKVDGHLIQQTSAAQAWSVHRSTDAMSGSYNAEASYLAGWKASKPTLSTAFAGKAVHVVGCKSPDAGLMAVYVDGKLKATVDTFQKFSSCNKTLVHLTGLSDAAHKITVAPVGTHNKKATGTKVSVDAVVAS